MVSECIENYKCCGNCKYYRLDGTCDIDDIEMEPYRRCYDYEFDQMTKEQRK